MKKDRNLIIEVFRRFVSDEEELDAVIRGAPIMDVLSIGSLAMVHLVTDLEKQFETRFDYETIERAFEDIHTLEAFLCGESKESV